MNQQPVVESAAEANPEHINAKKGGGDDPEVVVGEAIDESGAA